MRTAIPVNQNNLAADVSDNFGRAAYFMIYDDATDRTSFIDNTAVASSGGAGIKAAQLIIDNNVDAVLTPRLGEKAGQVLHTANIKIYESRTGSAKANLDAAQKGDLPELAQFHSGFHGGN